MPDKRNDRNDSYSRRLPHWRSPGAIYFVTWRLNPEQPDLEPNERSVVTSSIRHFAGDRYHLIAYVVMNDHCHALVQPIDPHRLQDVVHSWKSFTANRLQLGFGRENRVWQVEYFDRIVRDEREYAGMATYIASNPLQRWQNLEDYPWVGVLNLHGLKALCRAGIVSHQQSGP